MFDFFIALIAVFGEVLENIWCDKYQDNATNNQSIHLKH